MRSKNTCVIKCKNFAYVVFCQLSVVCERKKCVNLHKIQYLMITDAMTLRLPLERYNLRNLVSAVEK